MITLEQQVRPHPEVVDTTLDTGDVVLLHLDRKTYYSLNGTGAHIWQGVKDGLPLRAISQQLQARYAVESDHADRSVLALVAELLAQQLVQDTGA
jgi:Coenzyme PQQ synthesis protein D (PqqD)